LFTFIAAKNVVSIFNSWSGLIIVNDCLFKDCTGIMFRSWDEKTKVYSVTNCKVVGDVIQVSPDYYSYSSGNVDNYPDPFSLFLTVSGSCYNLYYPTGEPLSAAVITGMVFASLAVVAGVLVNGVVIWKLRLSGKKEIVSIDTRLVAESTEQYT
jgi:uncharacterized membrane protein